MQKAGSLVGNENQNLAVGYLLQIFDLLVGAIALNLSRGLLFKDSQYIPCFQKFDVAAKLNAITETLLFVKKDCFAG